MVKLLNPDGLLARHGWVGRSARFVRGFRRHFTALDIDGQVLRVVQTARRRGGIQVTRYVAEELDALTEVDRADPNIAGERIRQALERLKLKPKAVVMGVPRALVVLRTLHLPAPDDPRELASMVHFQTGKDLPFPIKEAVIDFKVRGEVEGSGAGGRAGEEETGSARPKVEVLVAAVKREVVEAYVRTAAAAGLELTALGLRSYANARCVGACNLAETGEHVALVSLRPDEVIIDVLEEQTLVFSRLVAVNTSGHSEEEQDREDEEEPAAATVDAPLSLAAGVTIEVVRSLHSYEGMMPHKRVSKVVVAGGTGDARAVVEALQNRLSVPCYLLNPARALGLPEASRAYAPGAMAAFGLGLGVNDPGGLPFDFLKPKEPYVPRDTRRLKWIASTALGVTVLVTVAVLFSHSMGKQRDRKAKAAAELRVEKEKSKKVYRPLLRQAQAVENWINAERNWLDHYAYLSRVLPSNQEIYLRSLTTSGDRIRLAVQAKSGSVLSLVDRQLRAAGYDVKPVSFVAGPNQHEYPFQTTVELLVPEKMEIDLVNTNGVAPPELEGSE